MRTVKPADTQNRLPVIGISQPEIGWKTLALFRRFNLEIGLTPFAAEV
jgi:hypothetical protein